MKESRLTRRSEKVRQRLKNESKAWVNQASRRLTEPDRDPVNNNTGSNLLPANSQAVKQNRFFRVGWRLVSLLTTAAFALGLYTLWNSPEYQVSIISIKGLHRIAQEEILSKLDLNGKKIFTIDRTQVMNSLQRSYPELWDIKVNLIMPNQVSIRLIERQPMIAWNYEDKHMWIDAEGYLIPARSGNPDLLTINADDLPTYLLASDEDPNEDDNETEAIQNIVKDKPFIKGGFQESLFFAFPKKITPNLLTAILQLNAWMPDEKELLYEAIRGVGWKDVRGWNVFIGSKLASINDKMLMYETIIRKLDMEGIEPTLVSVEFLHAPYYRLDD